MYLDGKLQEDRYSGSNFQGKKPEIGKKNIFTEKQTTNKVPLIFLDVKFLGSVNKQARYTVDI